MKSEPSHPARSPASAAPFEATLTETRIDGPPAGAAPGALAALLDLAPQAIITLTGEGRITGWNEAAAVILGWPAELALGRSFADFFADQPDEIHYLWERAQRGLVIRQQRASCRRRGGTLFEASVSVGILDDAGGRQIAIFIDDVSERQKATEKLRRSEARHRRLLAELNDIVYERDLEGRFTSANAAVTRILGWRPEEFAGKHYTELFHPDDLPRAAADLARSRRDGDASIPIVLRVRHKNGGYRHLELVGHVRQTQDGVAQGVPSVQGIARDVTDRVQAEADLQAKQRLLEGIATTAPVHLYVYDAKAGRLIYSSPYIQRLLGYTADEFLRLDHQARSSWVHPDDQAKLAQIEEQRLSLQGDEALTYEYRVRHKHGDYRWIRVREAVSQRDADGSVRAFIGAAVDISEEKLALQHLEEQTELLERIAQTLPVVLHLYDLGSQRLIYVSPHVERLLGYAPRELTGQSAAALAELVHPDDLAKLAVLRRAPPPLVQEAPLIVQFRLRTRDGRWRWLETHEVALRLDVASRPTQVLGATVDITEQKLADDAIAESQQRYQRLVETLDGIVWELDWATLRFTFVSPQAEKLLGYRLADWFEPNFLDRLLHPEDKERVLAHCRDEVSQLRDHRLEFRVVAADGRTVWLHKAVTVVTQDGRPVQLRGVFVDITPQRRAEESRQALQDQLQRMTELSPCVHYLFDVQQRQYLFLGQSFERLLGYPSERIMTEGEAFLQEIMHPDDWAELQRLSDRWDAVPDHEVLQAEFRYRHANGEYRWLRIHTVAFTRDEQGRVKQRMGVALDVTAERAAEEFRRAMEARIQQSQKLESLGILAGGIAHDFNNLLTAILGNAGLILISVPEGSPTADLAREIELAGRRASDLTQQMLAYAGRGRLVFQPLDLAELVREVHKLMRAVLPSKASFQFAFDEPVPLIEGDGTQLRQVLMNLLKNAAEALDEAGGSIRVKVAAVQLTEEQAHRSMLRDSARPGPHVLLEVSDSGCGMTQETLDRIFDPFFTTKFTGRGLGLSAVLGIVRGHRGTLLVRTAPGQGTSFQLFFPVAPATAAADNPEARNPDAPSKCVLVIEDNSSVADLTCRILQRGGYSVIVAHDGLEGLQRYQQTPHQIDLALVDLALPGLSGDQICRKIRMVNDAVPIVLMSGDFAAAQADGLARLPKVKLLNKPFTPSQLLDALQSLTA